MGKITTALAAYLGGVFVLVSMASCASTPAPKPAAETQQPMTWPQAPVLTCRARVAYARQFLGYFKEGLPEDRIIIASDWEPPEERDEILEIRRRVYHDQEALEEVIACSRGKET
ncbi:MAG TPA: hypothetical protein VMH26_08955 [Burkholderiales bacterium]|nr:hypothetical protein [Burkholderiales bacterium]